ncbi:hypothetical protein GGQ64_000386 [Rhizobium azooxidifex]|uniref:Anti-sigma factor n=1 Tax=Mycoplana azooxidifex TaxID=1636188 RepID=A0A7W6D6P7_9HYPH|nr:hypothetical protein [Mycoplana azooxidifex]MBB3975210.1 hypothetical protein [Mycoplana azooxidifex]
MTRTDFDDETLMAFADGELDEATSIELETALASDDALAARLAVFLDTRRTVADALKPLIDDEAPPRLAEAVARMVERAEGETGPDAQTGAPDNVVALHPQRRRPEPQRWFMQVAAGLVAVVAGVAGFAIGRSTDNGAPDANLNLAAALDSQASGRDVPLGTGTVLHVVSTFRDDHGELCREYQLNDRENSTLTIACRRGGEWLPRLALTSLQPADGYVPASSQETIDAYLASIHAGAPLSADEERAALSGDAENTTGENIGGQGE